MSREILYWVNRDAAEKALRTLTNIGMQANDGGAHPDIQGAGKRIIEGVEGVKKKLADVYKDLDTVVYQRKDSK